MISDFMKECIKDFIIAVVGIVLGVIISNKFGDPTEIIVNEENLNQILTALDTYGQNNPEELEGIVKSIMKDAQLPIEEVDTKYYLDGQILDVPLDKSLVTEKTTFISLDAVQAAMNKDKIEFDQSNGKLEFKLFKEDDRPDEVVAQKVTSEYYIDSAKQMNSSNSLMVDNKMFLYVKDLVPIFDTLEKDLTWDNQLHSVNIDEKEKDYTKKPDFLLTKENSFAFETKSWQDWNLSEKDNLGNTYKYGGISAGHTYDYYNNAAMTYRPNYEYSKFKGTIALSYEYRGSEKDYTIKIFFDDVEKQSFHITGGVDPIPFEFDISDVKVVKILRIADGGAHIGIVDAGFYK